MGPGTGRPARRRARLTSTRPAGGPERAGPGERDVDHNDVLPELRRRGEQRPVRRHDHRTPVEHQLVLATDEVHVDDGAPGLDRPAGEHLLAFGPRPGAEGRRVERQHDPRPGGGETGDRARGHPGVLADHHPDGCAADREDGRVPRTGDEPPLLVEHAVVREQFLHRDAPHRAGGADRGRVAQPAGIGHVADDRRTAAHAGRDGGERGLARGDKVRLQQQVLGRVAGHDELGEDGDVGAGPLSRGQRAEDPPDVPFEVADHRVDLAERDGQPAHVAIVAMGPPWSVGSSRDSRGLVGLVGSAKLVGATRPVAVRKRRGKVTRWRTSASTS